MPRRIPIIEARKRLTSLPEEIERDPEKQAVAITRRGKPVLALMSWELYEAIVETLEVMSDPEMMVALRESIRDLEEGRTVSLEEVKQELGL